MGTMGRNTERNVTWQTEKVCRLGEGRGWEGCKCEDMVNRDSRGQTGDPGPCKYAARLHRQACPQARRQ